MNDENKEGKRRPRVLRSLGLLGLAFAIFVTGVNVGNGRLEILSASKPSTATNNLPEKLDYSELDSVYRALKNNFNGKLTETQIIDGLKHGLAASAEDPYTVYFNEKEAKEFKDQLNNSFAGIGARLSSDADGNLIVAEPIEGFPAAKAGLLKQDIIIEVEGTATNGLTLTDAIDKIRGPAGSEVKLKIVRDKSQTLDFTITRDTISIPSVTSEVKEGNIGYIEIISFSEDTAAATRKAAQELKAAGVEGIVLDLRNNPGGLLQASVDVSSLWLPRGTKILEERRGKTVTESYTSSGGDILNGVPTVVLINEGSASASEITAGALKDNNAARLIGAKTYGKGVVQQLINLRDGGQLKVTVANWYRPNGDSIDKKGITPDEIIKPTEAEIKAEKDTQLEAALQFLNK